MRTVHLVYPCGKKISAPDSIGRNLTKFLINAGNNVINYEWDSYKPAVPLSRQDVLIGHAHPNPLTCFRRSLTNHHFAKRILLQPFTTYLPHVAYLRNVINDIDCFGAITGKYWFGAIDESEIRAWKTGMTQIDLAVDSNDFPLIKNSYNSIGHRKILYIGNSDECKDLQYLMRIAGEIGKENFGTAGAVLPGIKSHGYLDFSDRKSLETIKQYDFLLITSKADANPTVVLESMSWGLIPICTRTCGYTAEDGVIILTGKLSEDVESIKLIMDLDELSLKGIQNVNRDKILKDFTWENFCNKVQDLIVRDDLIIQNFQPTYNLLGKEIMSNRFFLRPSNLLQFFKGNLAK